jgi:menaquinol-cytochrome c reductase iron-sulfur subunit
MDRRNFLKRSVTMVNGMIGAVLAVPALRFLLHPLSQKRKTSEFVRVATLSSLTSTEPTPMCVEAERRDAYTAYPPAPIGNVFLIRESADKPAVRCLQVACPHLGCAIKFLTERKGFACPCHASDFDITGKRLAGPSPRDMDELECRVTEPDANGLQWIEVKYEEYHAGIAEKRAKH